MEQKIQVEFGEENKAEVLREYDYETGVETEASVAGVISFEEHQAIAEADALLQMQRTQGWKIVTEFIEAHKEKWLGQLILERDLDEMRRIQESLKAFASLTAFIESKIFEGERLRSQQTQDPTQG